MSTHSTHQPTPSDQWQPASRGEVAQLARSMRSRKSRRQFLKTGMGTIGGLLAAVGAWGVMRSMNRQREYNYGGVTCSEVAACSDDFVQGRLTPDEAAKVKQHVMLCPRCKAKFEQAGARPLLG